MKAKTYSNVCYSILGTILVLILIVLIWIPHFHSSRERARQTRCGVNLVSLARAMWTYASNYDNKYPTADKWCDLLLQHTKVSNDLFVCRGPLEKGGQKRCHYAINPNAEPNSPGDMVLLFETKSGWNQFGGPEILTAENHEGEGCHVLFNELSVQWVKTVRFGILKWKAEDFKATGRVSLPIRNREKLNELEVGMTKAQIKDQQKQ